jgi:hypothetical protein
MIIGLLVFVGFHINHIPNIDDVFFLHTPQELEQAPQIDQ